MSTASIVGNLGFGLYALAYLVSDVVLLRAMSVVAALAVIAFNWLVPAQPLWEAIAWNTLFLAINAGHLVVLLRRRNLRLDAVEQELLETVFRGFTGIELLRLLRIGKWRDVPAGTRLIGEGERVRSLFLLHDGVVQVTSADGLDRRLAGGSLLGELSFSSDQPAAATVVVVEPSRVLAWDHEVLRSLLRRNPSLSQAVQRLVNLDLVRKLRS